MDNKNNTFYFSTHDTSDDIPISVQASDALAQIKNATENIAKTIQLTLEMHESMVNGLTCAVSKATESIFNAKPLLEGLRESISNLVSRISLSGLSEDQMQEIIASYSQWGKFGWTCFPNAPMNFYNDPPLDLKDANAKVKHLCTTEGMEYIFNKLRKQKINHEDLESAIFCFQNRQYKACALLLFALIEAKMIREQKSEWRLVGAGAVDKLKKQIEEKKDEQLFYFIFLWSNLIACLEVLFEKAHNFEHEPDVINRNFVDHGMNLRRIRKRDCIQLFLVLSNLVSLLSMDV